MCAHALDCPGFEPSCHVFSGLWIFFLGNNMNRITFVPRSVARQWHPAQGAVLISVYSEHEGPPTLQEGWAAVLSLCFDDVDRRQEGCRVFSPVQARQVLEFARVHQDAPELVVHCEKGQSRSAAVALFLSELYQVSCYQETSCVTAMSWRHYNRKVYRVLSDEHFGPIGQAFADSGIDA